MLQTVPHSTKHHPKTPLSPLFEEIVEFGFKGLSFTGVGVCYNHDLNIDVPPSGDLSTANCDIKLAGRWLQKLYCLYSSAAPASAEDKQRSTEETR